MKDGCFGRMTARPEPRTACGDRALGEVAAERQWLASSEYRLICSRSQLLMLTGANYVEEKACLYLVS
jgi:hypothetical protein